MKTFKFLEILNINKVDMMKKILFLTFTIFLFTIFNSVLSVCVTPTLGGSYSGNIELCPGDYYYNDTVCNSGSGIFYWTATATNQTLDCDGAYFHGDGGNCVGGSWDFEKGLRLNSVSYNVTIKNCRIGGGNYHERTGHPGYYTWVGYFKNIIFNHQNTFGGFWVDNIWSNDTWCGGSWGGDFGGIGSGDPWISPYTYTILITDSMISCDTISGLGGGVFQAHYVNVTNHTLGYKVPDPLGSGGNIPSRWYVQIRVHDSTGNLYEAPVNITGQWNLWHTCQFEPPGVIMWTDIDTGEFNKSVTFPNQPIPFGTPPKAIDEFYSQKDEIILNGLNAETHPCDGYYITVDVPDCYYGFHPIDNNTLIDIEVDPANCPNIRGRPRYNCGNLGVCTTDVLCFMASIPEFIMNMIICINPIFILLFALVIASIIVLIMKKAMG